jgi:histidyl-tRNA synthetase
VRGTRDLLPPETDLWNHVEANPPRSSPATTSAKSAPPSSRTHRSSPAPSAKKPTSSPKRCTRGKTARGRSLKNRSPSPCVRRTPPAWSAPTSSTISARPGSPEALLHRPAVPPRAPAERTLSPVLADRRRGHRAAERRLESPLRDAEVLEMLATLLDELGITDWNLVLNSVGSSEDRARTTKPLREALRRW